MLSLKQASFMSNFIRMIIRAVFSRLLEHPKALLFAYPLASVFFFSLVFWRRLVFKITDIVLYDDLLAINAIELIEEIKNRGSFSITDLSNPDPAGIFFLIPAIFFLGKFIHR